MGDEFKKVKLIMDTRNAAFMEGDARAEIARILREAAENIEQGGDDYFVLFDTNGNSVGSCTLVGK